MVRLALASLLLLAACGPRHTMAPPPGFVRFEQSRALMLITADGIRLKSREVDNYPKGDLPFWTDALKRHLQARGYVLKSEACFRTQKQLDGCRLDFVLPHGAEDWILSEAVFVIGDRIALVEAAGPYARFVAIEAGLGKALETFDPGG